MAIDWMARFRGTGGRVRPMPPPPDAWSVSCPRCQRLWPQIFVSEAEANLFVICHTVQCEAREPSQEVPTDD